MNCCAASWASRFDSEEKNVGAWAKSPLTSPDAGGRQQGLQTGGARRQSRVGLKECVQIAKQEIHAGRARRRRSGCSASDAIASARSDRLEESSVFWRFPPRPRPAGPRRPALTAR